MLEEEDYDGSYGATTNNPAIPKVILRDQERMGGDREWALYVECQFLPPSPPSPPPYRPSSLQLPPVDPLPTTSPEVQTITDENQEKQSESADQNGKATRAKLALELRGLGGIICVRLSVQLWCR